MKRFYPVVTPTNGNGNGGADDGSPPKKKGTAPWASTPTSSSSTATATSSATTAAAADADAAAARTPLTFLSWNCNGLLQRLQSRADWEGFQGLLAREKPDVVALQEVKLPCARGGSANRRTRMHQGDTKAARAEYELVYAKVMRMGYKVVLSLGDMKRSGTLVMVKEALQGAVRAARFNLAPGEEHEAEGRVILLEFADLDVLATYCPNHGYSDSHFERRRRWDERMLAFLQARGDGGRPLVWLGDLNVSHLQHDVSHESFFASQRGPDHRQQPDPDFRGQPGYTPIERRRFSQLLAAGGLVDAYRALHPNKSEGDWTWRGSGPEHARYWAKGMRIDYTLLSAALLQPPHNLRIKRADILGTGVHRTGFLGSDHCPILLELERAGPALPALPPAAVVGDGAGAAAVAGEEQQEEESGDAGGGTVAVAVDGNGGEDKEEEEQEQNAGGTEVVDLSTDD